MFLQGLALPRDIWAASLAAVFLGHRKVGNVWIFYFLWLWTPFQHCFLGLKSLCFGFGRGRGFLLHLSVPFFCEKPSYTLVGLCCLLFSPQCHSSSPSQFTATPSTQLSRPNTWNHPDSSFPHMLHANAPASPINLLSGFLASVPLPSTLQISTLVQTPRLSISTNYSSLSS